MEGRNRRGGEGKRKRGNEKEIAVKI